MTSVSLLGLPPSPCVCPLARRNCFFSYTETDEKDVSLLLDATLLSHFRLALQQLPGMAINPHQPSPPTSILAPSSPPKPSPTPSPIQLIGYPLRAIQVLEGYDGHVDAAVISAVSGTLAAAHFSIFYVSTNHADYVLVQEQQLEAVMRCLADAFVLIKEEEEWDEDEEEEEEEGRDRLPPLPAHSPVKQAEEEKKDLPNHSDGSDEEQRLMREAHRQSMRRHRRRQRRGSAESRRDGDSILQSSTAPPRAEESIAEEESEGDEWSSTRESQLSFTPSTSGLLSSTPLSSSPALSSLSLSLGPSASFSSSTPGRPLQLQAMPYTLLLHSLAHTDLPSFFSSLLQLIFFPPTMLTAPRFFSYTMIDNDYSLITTPPPHLPSLPPSLLHSLTQSQQWSVIEALGVFRYDEAGLVSRISRPLSDAKLTFFYFSSWRTGFVIVHKEDEERAKEALRLHFEVVA